MMLNKRCFSIVCFLLYIIQITTSDCPFPKKEQIPNGGYVYRAPQDAKLKMAPENYSLHFRCAKGFIKRGAVVSYCHNGRWTRSVPTCLEMGCPDPPEIPNSIYTLYSSTKDITVGAVAIYDCGPEQVSVNYVLICTLDWFKNKVFWNGTTPECFSLKDKFITTKKEMKCTEPPAILYGDYILSSDSNDPLSVGTKAIYTCDSEFELDKSSDSVLTCSLRSDNNQVFWNGTTPACICKDENSIDEDLPPSVSDNMELNVPWNIY